MSSTNIINPEMLNMLKSIFRIRAGWRDISSSVSLYQNGAVAATINYAKVYVDDDKVHVLIRVTATAAGSAGQNIYIILPDFLTPTSGISTTQPLGVAIYNDTGTAHYQGLATYVADVGGLPAIAMFNANTTDGNVIGGNPNISIASGDIYSLNMTYEI